MKAGTQEHRITEQAELEGIQQEQVYCLNDTSLVTEDMQAHHLVLSYFTCSIQTSIISLLQNYDLTQST